MSKQNDTVHTILSTAAISLKPSATLNSNKEIAELKKKGIAVISLTTGEPKGRVPNYIKQAAIKAIKEDNNNYTKSSGLDQLREFISQEYNMKLGQVAFNKEDAIVTNGCKQALFNLFLATLNEGDEVIIPSPYWASYIEMIHLFKAKTIILKMHDDFMFDIEELKNAVSEKTKFILLNSPNNPSGAIYPESLLRQVVDYVVQNPKNPNINIITDDIYSENIYEINELEHNKSMLDFYPELGSKLFLVNGFSKLYCMMGWRIGWIISKNQEVINAINNIQSQSTSNVCNIVQLAAIRALEESTAKTQNYLKHIESIRKDYKTKRDVAYKILSTAKNINITKPKAAFYFFIDISKTNKSPEDISQELLTQFHVAVLPGSLFGGHKHIRMTFTPDLKDLKDACERMVNYFNNLDTKSLL